jgi:O-antigen/teichoic acid export membrane protein
MTSLRAKTISGMCWSLLQNIGGRGISFVATIILARILTPEIFGLVGMLAIFIQVSQALVMAGFNEALIQKKDTDEKDYSSVFWINLGMSLLIYTVLFLLAPFIADFYHQAILTDLTRVLSLVFVINAFSYVQEARLRKDMRFKTLTVIHLPAVVIGGFVGIIMAVQGLGIWSLVAMELVSRLTYAIQIWIYAKWRPLFSFHRAKAKRLFSFGGKLMFSAILNAVYQNIYLVIIGKFFPLSSVGYYQTANKVVNTPSVTLSSALNSVVFPAFSSIQDDNKRLKEGYKKIIKQLFFWMCPAFILAAVLAEPLFRFVFTEKWLPAVPFFRILCIVGILYPMNAYNLSIVNVKGRSDLFLKLEIIKKAFTTIGILVAIPLGIWALLIFQAISSVFAYFVNSYYSGRFIQYALAEQLKDILPALLLSIIVGGIIFLVNQSLNGEPDFIRLLSGFGLGVCLYALTAKYCRFSSYQDIAYIFQAKFSKHVYR